VKGGREGRDLDALQLAQVCEKLGAGEILLNCIDKDDTNSGFDIELANILAKVFPSRSLPLLVPERLNTSPRSLKRPMWKPPWPRVFSTGKRCQLRRLRNI